MTVVLRGADRGHMEFILHHQVDGHKLAQDLKRQRKNLAEVFVSVGGKLVVKPNFAKLTGTDKDKALTKLHTSLARQVEHVNNTAREAHREIMVSTA